MKNNNKILNLLGKNKYILLVVLVGIFLLLIPTGVGGERQPPAATAPAEFSEFSVHEQEQRISDALSQIDGAGDVTVVLTLKSSGQRVFAQDIRTSNRGENSAETSENTVIISAGSQQQRPVTLKYIYPRYLGALVIAEGAGNAAVRLELLNAVAALTGLSTDRITITRMQNS